MSANDGPSVRDVILKELELAEMYHDQKTHSAWIASSLYFTFSIGFITYWPKIVDAALTDILATIACSGILICAMSFVSLQFKGRWDAVVRSGMLHWLVQEKWASIGGERDYRNLQKHFAWELREKQELGIRKKRRVLEIAVTTVFLPVVLLAGFFHSMWAESRLENIETRIREIEKQVTDKEPRAWKRDKPYRQKRRCEGGLIDTRYRTEIPAYTISLYFFAAQMLLIWDIV